MKRLSSQIQNITCLVGRWQTALLVLFIALVPVRSLPAQDTSGTLLSNRTTRTSTPATLSTCEELPSGDLTEEDLRRLVPENSSGTVYVRWRTEAEYNLSGYNVLRREDPSEPYKPVNPELIPGKGPKDKPQEYCFADRPLPRGKVYYYSVQTVNDKGQPYIVKGTEDTKVRVKTVDEEREWLRKRARGKGSELRTLPPTERFIKLELKETRPRSPVVDDRHTTALY